MAYPYDVTPDILSATVSWFDGGADFPAGEYVVAYVTGAMQYAYGAEWKVNFNDTGNGFHVTDDGGNDVFGPGNDNHYDSVAECEAGNAGLQITYNHTGGKIGMYLEDDPYDDNSGGSPSPTFSLNLPTVTIAPGNNASSAMAGTLLWPIPIIPGYNPSSTLAGAAIVNQGPPRCSWQEAPYCPGTQWMRS